MRRELRRTLQSCLEHGLTAEAEARLQSLMALQHPSYARLHGENLVQAGLILVGTWRLAHALSEAEA